MVVAGALLGLNLTQRRVPRVANSDEKTKVVFRKYERIEAKYYDVDIVLDVEYGWCGAIYRETRPAGRRNVEDADNALRDFPYFDSEIAALKAPLHFKGNINWRNLFLNVGVFVVALLMTAIGFEWIVRRRWRATGSVRAHA